MSPRRFAPEWGAITGRGLADLIREEYGVKVTLLAMAALLVANFATTVSEFAGILAAVQIFVPHLIARFVVLPLVAVGVWFVVTRGSYKRLERILLGASLIYLFYIVSAFLSHPNWGQALRQTVQPDIKAVNPLGAYIFMIINVVGTTITPWGQFYIQSSVRDKGIQAKDYGLLRADVFFGAFFTNFIAYFIIVCCGATLFTHGIHDLQDAGQAAQALAPLAGKLATVLFAIGTPKRLLLRRDYSAAFDRLCRDRIARLGIGASGGERRKRRCSSASSRFWSPRRRSSSRFSRSI